MTNSSALEKEIMFTRTVTAPRERVWEAWTDPKQIAIWWGPNGFTNTIHEMEVKPGGVWRFMMHGPDGTDYPNKVVYEEVLKPERLVYLHSDDIEGELSHVFRATATFEEEGDKTRVTLKLLTTPEEHAKMVKFGATEGGNQTLGRLEQFMTGKTLS